MRNSTKLSVLATLGTIAAFLSGPCRAAQPVVRPAIDAVMAAFETHPIVAIGDRHGLAQEADFYAALVRDPRFAKQVGNIVVEFGGARDQSVVDRYVNGDDVLYVELRKAWTDTPGVFVGNMVAINFFAQVRAVNLTLPPSDRIRVWLGEPVIDWSKIKGREDFEPIVASRDAHAAEIILNDILAKHKRTLAIYGSLHFDRHWPAFIPRPVPTLGAEERTRKFVVDATNGTLDFSTMTDHFATEARARRADWQRRFRKLGALQSFTYHDLEDSPAGDGFDATFTHGKVHVALGVDANGKLAGAVVNAVTWEWPRLIEVLDKAQPGATYVIEPYVPLNKPGCPKPLEEAAAAWPVMSLVTPDPRAALGPLPPGCPYTDPSGQALLYLGDPKAFTTTPRLPDLYVDLAYRREMARIETIKHFTPGEYDKFPDMSGVTNSPVPFR
jgi:hypothetical protein